MKRAKQLFIAAALLGAFILWTVMVCYVDVRPVGPQGSLVGLAKLNQFVHDLTGVHFTLYNITDWLGLVPVAVCLGFGILGLCQLFRRKSLGKVDFDILALGVFYILTIGAYLFFENLVVNYRPVLIRGYLEVSYPSSTTLLVLCVMPTAIMQFQKRIQNPKLRKAVRIAISAFIIFMVIGRLLSGVHWFSDIIGGLLLSGSLVKLYDAVIS